MKTIHEIEGHSIEIMTSSTGSMDPWSSKFADTINVSLMVTADIAVFMLVDAEYIYKFRVLTIAHDLHDLLEEGKIKCWQDFRDWISNEIETGRVVYINTFTESRKSLVDTKKRSDVWKSIPKDKRSEVYEYLKTLSKEEKENWFNQKIKELENENRKRNSK